MQNVRIAFDRAFLGLQSLVYMFWGIFNRFRDIYRKLHFSILISLLQRHLLANRDITNNFEKFRIFAGKKTNSDVNRYAEFNKN
jgi:hypothetical protein